jgi:hypothetical protein
MHCSEVGHCLRNDTKSGGCAEGRPSREMGLFTAEKQSFASSSREVA